jgi:hypothetical protein
MHKKGSGLLTASTRENYAAVIDTLHGLNSRFETTYLQSMYQESEQ